MLEAKLRAILVRAWKDKNAERNLGSGGLDHEISEDNRHSTGNWARGHLYSTLGKYLTSI